MALNGFAAVDWEFFGIIFGALFVFAGVAAAGV